MRQHMKTQLLFNSNYLSESANTHLRGNPMWGERNLPIDLQKKSWSMTAECCQPCDCDNLDHVNPNAVLLVHTAEELKSKTISHKRSNATRKPAHPPKTVRIRTGRGGIERERRMNLSQHLQRLKETLPTRPKTLRSTLIAALEYIRELQTDQLSNLDTIAILNQRKIQLEICLKYWQGEKKSICE